MNSIKTYLNGLGRATRTTILALAVVFVSAGIAQAATTISTNISTGGTLGVTGLSSLGSASSTQFSANTAYFGQTATSTFSSTGALTLLGGLSGTSGTFSTTLGVTGLTSLIQASSTRLSVFDTAYFGGTATSTFSSAGALTLITDLTLQNGEVISNSTNAVVSIGGASDTLKILGTASTSALKVGDEPAAPTMNGMVFGYCSFSDVTLAASSTNGFANCTATPAGALLANDRVFVQATSSFESQYVITAASTTDANTIQLRILNTGLGLADGTLSGTSVNFWALR